MIRGLTLTVSRARTIFLVSMLGVLVAWGTAGAVGADFTLALWQYFKTVDMPAGLAEGDLLELTLDREVFLQTSQAESDLRLIAGHDREVPYHLVVLVEKVTREPVPVEIRDLGHVEGEYSTFVADLGPGGALHSEVEIVTTDRNFRREVQVETSADGQDWAVVQNEGEIYDFTSADGQFNVHHTAVRYPQSAARYLRIKVFDGDEAPLEVSGGSVFLTDNVPSRETAHTPASVSTTRDDSGITNHLLDMGVAGIPASRISFQSDSGNFYRPARVEGSLDLKEWRRLGGTDIYSFNSPGFVGSVLEMDFAESRFRYYRMGVEDGDNAPLVLSGFALHSLDRKVLFQKGPEEDYFLYYGNPAARAPTYDLEHILPYLETDDLPAASLGGQQVNESFEGIAAPWTERFPWLLPVGVSLAALVVAALLYGVIRQAKRVFPPPGEGASAGE